MTKHRVQQGEKLSTIAARYGVSHQAFLGSNPDRETTTLPSGETVFRSLSTGGTELQIEDAYHNMRAAALALQTTMLH